MEQVLSLTPAHSPPVAPEGLIEKDLCGFQGELEITTEAGSGKAAQPGPDGQLRDHVERMPFLMLALDLPPAPLYKDALEKDIIPQVPNLPLLMKHESVKSRDF